MDQWNNPTLTEVLQKVIFCNTATSHVTYKVAKVSEADSFVMFHPGPSDDSQYHRWHAGSIISIFQHQVKGSVRTTFLLVQPFRSVEPEQTHPAIFRLNHEFAFVTGHLFYVGDQLPPMLVPIHRAIGHFAYVKVEYHDATGHSLFQVLPLEKVKVTLVMIIF